VCTPDLGCTGGNDIAAGTETDFVGVCTPALRVQNSCESSISQYESPPGVSVTLSVNTATRKNCSGDKVKINFGWSCSTYGEDENSTLCFSGETVGKEPLWKVKSRWDNDMKMDPQWNQSPT